MIYNTARISDKIDPETGEQSFDFSVEKSDMDRVLTKTLPNPLGHYHYPIDLSDKEALEELRLVMIKA